MRCSDASSPFPLRFVSFTRRYRTRRHGGLSLAEATGPPRFLGNPCVHALVSDPGRSTRRALRRKRRSSASVLPSTTLTAWAPATIAFRGSIQGFHARCLRFAARGVPSDPRKTRFRLGANLGRGGPRDLHGFHHEVSAFYMGFLLIQAWPGAPKVQKLRSATQQSPASTSASTSGIIERS